VLEQSLRKLGVERLSKDDVQRMQWEVLEAKIGNWIHYMRISVKKSLPQNNNTLLDRYCFLRLHGTCFCCLETGETVIRRGKENLRPNTRWC